MLILVVLFPLLGAFLNGLILRKVSPVVSHAVGSLAMIASAVCAVLTYLQFLSSGGDPQIIKYFDWITAGSFAAPFQLILDRLSGLMMLIITIIGSLIHIYAGGYMHEEEVTSRFFAYLNLFVFMMLLLVLGDNMLVMFVGWEGVGLCSYLLIGYWYQDDANAAAGMKAFLVNRIGDIGFLLGIFLTFVHFGTISFSELRELVGQSTLTALQLGAVGWITLCMFIGATGKSAQIPLYVWLPDAMAGPTPVSALIHAATMVTAGIYMMTRLNFMYFLAPNTMLVVATVGALTALFAATIALVQNDIKKVLAYSTVSQLGFMVLGCGVGAFDAGVFHLLTHACFKALLFLGAGSVIVAMHHKQDMREMGGLKSFLPITHFVFLVGVLAIIGFPGLSGFFSKDEILWRTFIFPQGGKVLWAIAALAAVCTSFYMVRLLFLTFYGPNRSDHHTKEHLHETGPVMWAPLVVLAIASAFIGYLNVPHVIPFPTHLAFSHYLENVLLVPEAAQSFWSFAKAEHSFVMEVGVMAVSIVGMVLGSGYAWMRYSNVTKTAPDSESKGVHNLLRNKYWIDELYFAWFVEPLKNMAFFLWSIVDKKIIDGLVNGVGSACAFLAGVTSFRMSGSLHRHGMAVVIGMLCLILALAA